MHQERLCCNPEIVRWRMAIMGLLIQYPENFIYLLLYKYRTDLPPSPDLWYSLLNIFLGFHFDSMRYTSYTLFYVDYQSVLKQKKNFNKSDRDFVNVLCKLIVWWRPTKRFVYFAAVRREKIARNVSIACSASSFRFILSSGNNSRDSALSILIPLSFAQRLLCSD